MQTLKREKTIRQQHLLLLLLQLANLAAIAAMRNGHFLPYVSDGNLTLTIPRKRRRN